MPEVCPCYPRHVSVWTMDSREHQDGERKVGVGVAERGRQTVGGNWIWRIGNRWLVLIGIN